MAVDRHGARAVAESLNLTVRLEAEDTRNWAWCGFLKPDTLHTSPKTALSIKNHTFTYMRLQRPFSFRPPQVENKQEFHSAPTQRNVTLYISKSEERLDH